jgi:hypothetical protein
MTTSNIRPITFSNQRRSQRILLSVPVQVSGRNANGALFSEETTTLIVNAQGGLIALKQEVAVGQTISVKHETTLQEISSAVMNIEAGTDGVREIGIEFVRPDTKFWRVTFPPIDWTSRSPEAKRFERMPERKRPKSLAEKE